MIKGHAFNIGAVHTINALFGEGLGPIEFLTTSCTGSEMQLIDCPHGTGTNYYCSHRDDAGVKCHARTSKHYT